MVKSLSMSAKFEEKINGREGTRLHSANDRTEDGIKAPKECTDSETDPWTFHSTAVLRVVRV